MLRLLLLRHAKSSWTDPGVEDRDRPLNERGREAAPAMGRFMRQQGYFPALVLCSPARRAHDTWNLVSKEIEASPEVVLEEAIYDFGDGGRVLDAIRRHGSGATSLLVVGHNPSLEALTLKLIGKGDAKLRSRIAQKYPTCALAVLEFERSNWRDVKYGEARLVSFTRPKDISD